MQFVRLVVLLVTYLSVASCGGSGDSDSSDAMTFDGSRSSLPDFYSEEMLLATESLGLSLNFGDESPNVEGIFRVEPVVLQATSNPNDAFGVGNTGVPFSVTFSNQDSNSLVIDVSDGTDLTEVTQAVISGSGNAFTVFALVAVPAIGVELPAAYSGNLTEFGIENFQYAPFTAADVNVRLFVDQDNLSERQ